jgi:Glycosyl hydrolase family 67 N-terminus
MMRKRLLMPWVCAPLVVSFVFWAGCRRPGTVDGRIVLAADGTGRACIVAGPEDRIAALSLQKYIRQGAGAALEIVAPEEAGRRRERCQILVGTPESNPAVALAVKEHGLGLDRAALGEEGYILKTLPVSKGHRIIAAGTEKRGVFYAVGELKRYYLRKEGNELLALTADVRESPAFKYRWLWTWDWRMEWGGTEAGGVTMGEGDYKKRPESFLKDYKACIDFMSENGLNGLIIWGFLRDAHGDIEASREICRYANERGVRILPGIGTSGYRGYYFEGDHEFNAPTWVRRHPELASRVLYEGKPVPGCPCPSKPENKKWLADGARWLFENFAIGGVNLEMGDFFVCPCPDCSRARAAIASDEPDYYKDMAICLRELIPVMRAAAPDAWLSYATYTGFNKDMMARPPKFIELIPDDAICQWTVTGMMGDKDIPDPMRTLAGWPADLKPMARHNIGYLHWANKSTATENDFFVRRFQAAAANSARSGLEGLAFYGELGDGTPNMLLNYLAFKEFCFHPEMTAEEFTAKRLAPLYGGNRAAELWQVIDSISGLPKRNKVAAAQAALAVVSSAEPAAPAHAKENWRKLADFLQSIKQ